MANYFIYKPLRVFTMNISLRLNQVIIAALFSVCLILAGCGTDSQSRPDQTADLSQSTIVQLTEMLSYDPIPVEGYGLVTGLNGNGSSHVPQELRRYFQQYIHSQLPTGRHNVTEMLDSLDTAVVRIRGTVPVLADSGQKFDIMVSSLSGADEVSLENGLLLEAELRAGSATGATLGGAGRPVATARGPIYIHQENDRRSGIIIGGGRSTRNFRAMLSLIQPDFRTVVAVRGSINERFSSEVATAPSENLLELRPPTRYSQDKARFISVVRSIYIERSPEQTQQRIKKHIEGLKGPDKMAHEIALEAIGVQAEDQLRKLLDSDEPELSFRAARVLLYLGFDDSLEHLRPFAYDADSPWQDQTLQAVHSAARRNEALRFIRRLLNSDNFQNQRKAYEILTQMDDPMIYTIRAGNTHIDLIENSGPPRIYALRKANQRIALFGPSIKCKDDIFVPSPESTLTINATPDDEYVRVIRQHPRRPGVMMRLNSSRDLSDIIETMAAHTDAEEIVGLNVPYCRVLQMIELMVEKGAIEAEFEKGPLPVFGRR